MLVALLILEGAVRVLHLGPRLGAVRTELFRLSDDPVLRYELQPGARVPGVVINSHGMRDDEPASGARRIALFGDSIAFGYGAEQQYTAAAWMERILNDHYRSDRPFDVLNFGVTGYNIAQDLRMLERRSTEFDDSGFEAVVVFYCLNDPQDYSFELEQLRSRLDVAHRRYFAPQAGRWVGRSRLFQLLRLQWEQRTQRGRQQGIIRPEPDWASLRTPQWARYFLQLHQDPAGWKRVQESFARFGEFSREHDVPVVLVIFPVMKQLDSYPLKGLHARVGSAAAAAGLQWVDLAGLYAALQQQKQGAGIFDELHPDGVGYAVAALATSLTLLRDGRLRLEPRDLGPVAAAPAPLGPWARWVQARVAGD